MSLHQFMLCCVLATILSDAVWSSLSCTYATKAVDCYYYIYNKVPVETITGAVVGGIVGLIVLCVIIAVVCKLSVAKREPQEQLSNHPAFQPCPQQWLIIYKVWESCQVLHQIKDTAISINNRIRPPHPASQTKPPPTYAENVVSGQHPVI